jgi:prolyl oligopeptidase
MACLVISGISVADARDGAAQATKTVDVVDTVQGVKIADPYRWLEESANPEVRTWVGQQSQRTRAHLDALPFRAAVRQRLEALITQASPRHYSLKYESGRLFAMYFDPARQQPSLVVMGPEADPAKARTVLDPNVLDASGGTAIDWYVPSPDGRRVAVSLSKGGSEAGTLYVFETDSGKQVGETIPEVQYPTGGGDVAWRPDGKGFWYTRYKTVERAEDRGFFQQLYFHEVGADPAKDARVFGENLPRIAEIRLDWSDAAGKLLITVQNGDGGEFAHFVGGEDSRFVQVTQFQDGVDFMRFGPDAALYLVSERNAPRREIQRLAAGVLDLERATTIVPQGEDVIPIEFWYEDSFVFVGKRMYVRYLAGGPSRVRIFELDGKPAGEVPLPEIAAVDEIEPVGDDLLYSVETYLTPTQFHRFGAGRSVPTNLKVTSPVKFDDMEVRRAFATSKDGTRVPINVIGRKGLERDGGHPTLLYGYGGYGVSETPYFLGASRRIWFDAGGVYAAANIRGGGEYGEEWHRKGMLTAKQNVFDDFIAAAEYLIENRYTHPDRLAILGGSNGGLLMGAMVTQRPELFRAVVAQVGVFDMIRVELDPNGQFNIPEFGTVRNPDHFKAMYAYSPYHRVRDGVRYPAMFFSTGENDGRVNPMHSRKMTARLQAATASDHPIYLITTGAAGHGQGSPLAVQIDQTADWLSFLMDQLGMGAKIASDRG